MSTRLSPTLAANPRTSRAVNALIAAATGLRATETRWYISDHTSLTPDEAFGRLHRGHPWTARDIGELAAAWKVTPTVLSEALEAVIGGSAPGLVVDGYGLDQRPTLRAGGAS